MAEQELNLSILPSLGESSLDNFMSDEFLSNVEGTEEKVIPAIKKAAELTEHEEVETPAVGSDGFIEPTTPEGATTDEDPNKVWAEWARENGLIDYKDEEFKPEEGEGFIKDRFQASVEAKAKELREAEEAEMPEVIKELRANYREGVPIMQLIESENRLQEFSAVKPEQIDTDIDLQKDIVATYLSSKDFTAEEIKERLTKFEDAGLLKDEAKTNIKQLIKEEVAYKANLIEANKKEQESRRQQVEASTKKFEEDIMKSTELFKDLPWTEKEKKIVLSTIMKPVGKGPNGQVINELNKMQMEDPMFLPKLAYMAKVLKWDFTPLKTIAKTQATKALKKAVTTYTENGTEGLSPTALANYKAAQKAIKEMKKTQIF